MGIITPANPFIVIAITIFIAAVVYLLDSLYARKFLRIGHKAIGYVAAAVFIGVFGEVFVETIYNTLFGHPLWYYQFLPVHHAYTSQFSIILWAMYGLHVYWIVEILHTRRPKLAKKWLVSILAVESLLLETFANLVFMWVFGNYLYYYTPNDLWHVTTIQNIPCCFAAAWAMASTAKRFNKDPVFYGVMSALILLVFLFFV